MDVDRCQKGLLPFFLQHQGQLGGGCRLAGALQAVEHDHRETGRRDRQPAYLVTQNIDQGLVHDLDDLLAGCQRAHDGAAFGFLGYFGNQVLDNLQMHVGFEQRQADLAHHRAEVLFADPSLAAHAADDCRQFSGQSV